MPDDDRTFGFAIPLHMLQQQQEKPNKARPTQLAQVMELENAFGLYTTHTPFKPGDLVTEADGVGMLADEPEVIMIMRTLSWDREPDRSLMVAFAGNASNGPFAFADCLIAYKQSGGALSLLPYESWRLRRYIPEAKS
jgi:hypothetical protein